MTNLIYRRVALAIAALIYLGGCSTQNPAWNPNDANELTKTADKKIAPGAPHEDHNQGLKTLLGMQREITELGFEEKSFNPCSFSVEGQKGCPAQFFGVVHFQLLCRDTEGSVSIAPVRIEPITSESVRWQMSGATGPTHTDARGYGEFSVVSNKSNRDQRLILRIGVQFIGVNVSEISRIVLPKNFCRKLS